MTPSSRSGHRPSPEADGWADPALQKALAGVQALMDEGRWAEALARLEALAHAHPGEATVFNKMGICLARLERLSEAARAFERAAELDPAYPAPWSNLGNVHLQEGRLGEAETAYRRALAIDPDYAPAHNNLAAALRRMGRYDEAVHHLKQSVRLQRDGLEGPARPVATRWLAYGILGLAALVYWLWRQRGALVAVLAVAAWASTHAVVSPTAAARSPDETLVVRVGAASLELRADSLGLRLVPTRPGVAPDAGRPSLGETEPACGSRGRSPRLSSGSPDAWMSLPERRRPNPASRWTTRAVPPSSRAGRGVGSIAQAWPASCGPRSWKEAVDPSRCPGSRWPPRSPRPSCSR
ncbi:tetratricopeptide repeat protein [Geochorda subterranea]|uniref:Tetratricopeptide repeat protein n=1 Tax=Geochorda subterranea TaxID=3109564 RepID=A0ABZ1BPV9_9FIRM|nr:tetratricopeptide repeat protein [Limnochorda sp. LNt]WRP14663.1 tetratricopeptide repeat protein [Limnochorda sp. LNt]